KHALTDIDGNPREAEPGEAPLEISADCKAFMKINDVCSAEIEEHCSSDFYGGDIMIRSAGASPSGPSRRRSELAARRRCRSRRPRRRGGRRGEGRLEGEAEGGQAAGDEGHQEGGQGPEAPPPPQEERPVRWRAARPPRARAGSSGLRSPRQAAAPQRRECTEGPVVATADLGEGRAAPAGSRERCPPSSRCSR
ncbi:unnamed protein product, partial [Prorocentrum cordatum]